jgi:hypothetical protein
VNHTLPSSAEVKNEWSYTSPPLYAFMAWTGKTSNVILLFCIAVKCDVPFSLVSVKNLWASTEKATGQMRELHV